MVDTSVSEVNLSTVSERKVESIDDSEQIFYEGGITDNRIVDMELFAAAIHMLGISFVKTLVLFFRKIMKKKKGLASLLTIKCTLCDFCTEFYTSRS